MQTLKRLSQQIKNTESIEKKKKIPRLPSVHYYVYSEKTLQDYHIQKDHVVSSGITIAKTGNKLFLLRSSG